MNEENNVCLSKNELNSTYLSKPKVIGVGKTQEKYIEEVRKVHPEYDFSDTIYKGSKSKLKVKCPTHGEFEILAGTLLKGSKCPYCNWDKAKRKFSKTLDTFLEEVKPLHPTYDFSKVVYTNTRTKVEVICDKHGSFFITPTDLLKGSGCNICGNIKIGLSNKISKEEYLERVYKKLKEVNSSLKIFEDTYVDRKSKITIECEKHGVMEIGAMALEQNKLGCPKCGLEGIKKSQTTSYSEVLDKVTSKFGDKIKLKEDTYVNSKTKMTCECSAHGVFKATPHYLINTSKSGCPKCGLEEGGKKSRVPYETFIKKANKKFKGKFTYLEETYKGNSQKMVAICPQHGEIGIIPYAHIRQEYGCYSCMVDASGAYYLNKPTTLYYIKLIKGEEEYFKLGITTTTLETRFNKLHTDGVTYQIIATKTFPTGSTAYYLEQYLLQLHSSNIIDFILLPKSGGNSEIFNQDIYESIKQYFD